jgi:DNA-binding transcriptional regulator YiaG
MSPQELRTIRHALGLSQAGLAELVGAQSARTVRRWECGDRAIPAPVAILLRLVTRKPETLPVIRDAADNL